MVDLRALFYDTTNFDTFLSSDNPGGWRSADTPNPNVRISHCGLGLLVSWDFTSPLFSQALCRKPNDR